MMMAVPDEAVEAAHKAWREQAALPGTIFEYNLRAALEAAAPFIAAQAWDAAVQYADDQGCLLYHEAKGIKSHNPYRSEQ